MTLGRIVFFILFAISIALFLGNLYRLFALLCLGRWENRFDRLAIRLKNMLVYAFGQLRVIRTKYGFNHFIIFWGFISMLALNSEFLIAGLFPDFSFEFLGSIPYGLLLFVTDIMSLIVIVAVAVAVIRRCFFRPAHIEFNLDAFAILSMIAILMIAYFGYHAGEIHLEETDYAAWMPISSLFAGGFASYTEEGASALTAFYWWIHAGVLLAFLNYLPYSKHLHVITAIPNCFFRRFDFPQTVPPVEFKMGNNFGNSKVTQFTWKDLLDFMSCTECGRCEAACPAHNTGKPLNPKEIVHIGKLNLFSNGRQILSKRPCDTLAGPPEDIELDTPLIGEGEKSVTVQALWDCTTCGACMQECPVFIEHVPKIVEMRRHLVMEKSEFPEELLSFFENSEQRFNPWGIAPTDRSKWTADLDVNIIEEGKPVEYLYFVGCSGAFDSRTREVVTAITKIFNAAGLSWGILGTEERCCGDSLRRLGNEYVFENIARDNIERFRRFGVTKIITHCPHGFSTLKNDYSQFGADFEVIHHSQMIDRLIQEGKIKLTKTIQDSTVIHDSCYLGRYNDIYEEPRNVVTAALGGEAPIEMKRSRQSSFCCGAGGGGMWVEESGDKRIYAERTKEAIATNASTIAVACPFCMTMFEDGVKEENKEQDVRVKDIAELVAEAME